MTDLRSYRQNRLDCIAAIYRNELDLSKFFHEDIYCDYLDTKVYRAVKCKCCIWDCAIFGNPKVLCKEINSTRKCSIDSDLYPSMEFTVRNCEKWNSLTSTADTLFHWVNEILFDVSGNPINYIVHRHNNCARIGRMLISTYPSISLSDWLSTNSDTYLIFCLIRQWAFLLHLWENYSLRIKTLRLEYFAVIPVERVLTIRNRTYSMPVSLVYQTANNVAFKLGTNLIGKTYEETPEPFNAFVSLVPQIDLKIPIESNYFDFCFT